jgi:hypothetical protein
MGDARHKNPPPPGPGEIVTPAFRKQARDIMRANKVTNRLHGWKPGNASRLIENDADLAVEVIGNKKGKTQIANILGPVKPTTKPRGLIDRTTFLPAIRKALKMDGPVSVNVEPSRVPVVSWIAGLPEEDFVVFENAYKAELRRRG